MSKVIKDLYFFFLIIFTGIASSFYRSKEGVITLLFISLLMMLFYKVKLGKSIVNIVLIWLMYVFIVTVRNQTLNPYHAFKIFAFIIVGYIIFKLYHHDFEMRYENTLVFLAVVSLLFFSWEIISKSTLLNFARQYDVSMGLRGDFNIILYSITPRGTGISFPRNHGFCFEPGPFSIYLNIAIFFNLMRNKMKLKNNRNFWILLVTMFTTQSTTGVIGLFAMYVYMMRKSLVGAKKYFYIILIIGSFIYALFSFDFMLDKLVATYEGQKNIEGIIAVSDSASRSQSAGRVGGFLLALEDFKSYPLFGIGGLSSLSERSLGGGVSLGIINGWAATLSGYGLFGIFITFFGLKKTSKYYAEKFNMANKYALLILLSLSLVSFNFTSQIILFYLVMLGYFNKDIKYNKIITHN